MAKFASIITFLLVVLIIFSAFGKYWLYCIHGKLYYLLNFRLFDNQPWHIYEYNVYIKKHQRLWKGRSHARGSLIQGENIVWRIVNAGRFASKPRKQYVLLVIIYSQGASVSAIFHVNQQSRSKTFLCPMPNKYY